MSVKLHEIMSAAHARSASLAAEVAGYLVLGTADQIAGAPRSVGFSDVSLSEEGQVRIAGGTPVDDARAEQTLREMLGLMLLESSSVTPGLLRAAHKPSSAGVDSLIREIEVALVPVNRAAARRALARLHRDVERARDAGRLVAWEAPRPATDAPAPAAARPLPEADPPARARGASPAPAPVEMSVDLSSVLMREPEAVAVVDVEWPVQPGADEDAELLTMIPVYVEELAAEAPEPASVPMVPDLEVPPSPAAPPARSSEPITVPQPLVAPSRARPSWSFGASEGSTSRTPVLGSSLTVLEPPEPLVVSEPVPAVLVLGGDDATERMPSVHEEEELAVSQVLADVARAFIDAPELVVGLETADPPQAGEPAAARTPSPAAPMEPVTPEPAAQHSPGEVAWTIAHPSPSPLPVMSAKDSLEQMATLPARPRRHDYAPPRYAPRQSDVNELLSGFGVANAKTERELCLDLKALAGVEQTAPPPMVELSETPPPVAVSEIGETRVSGSRPSEGSNARVVAGAVSAALIIAGVALGSIPTRDPDSMGATAAAAGDPGAPDEQPVAPCTAELTVRHVPPNSRARIRTNGDPSVLAPSRVVGADAVFEGLACRQSAEVTVELPGRARWVRIPVAADALSPSADAPSLVRYTVAVR